MSIKTAMFCAVLGLASGALPSVGSARVYVDVDVAPPAPRVEVIPEARVGYVWAPGYWDWDGQRYVWMNGHYIHERHGRHWVADHWERHHDHWRHIEGHWD